MDLFEKSGGLPRLMKSALRVLSMTCDIHSINHLSKSSVKFLYNSMKQHDAIPLPPPPLMKTAANSIQFRRDGNEHYSSFRNFEAFTCYSRAIAHAPPGSEQLALAYSNRSAALLDLGHSKACIKDIDRALAIGCDENRKKNLLERRKKCVKLKIPANSSSNADEFKKIVLKMRGKTRSDIPCASEKISIAYDAMKGRKIIANEDMKPGEILAIEEPYVAQLDLEKFIFHCYHCLKKSYELIPCDTCSYAMFCDDTCKSNAWDQYHNYECPIMYYLNEIGSPMGEMMGIRIALKARREYGSWTELWKSIEQMDAETDPLKKGFVDGIYSSKYAAIHGLTKNSNKISMLKTHQLIVRGAVFASLLKDHSGFLDGTTDEETWLTGLMIANSILAISMNVFNIEGSYSKIHGLGSSYKFASGVYAFQSLFNHSCVSNTIRTYFGHTSVFLSSNPIKKGEEITTAYGVYYDEDNREHRRGVLLEFYNFDCNCEACENNWGPDNISAIRINLTKQLKIIPLLSDETRTASIINQKTAFNVLNKVYHNLTILNEHKLTVEYVECSKYLLTFWRLLGNVFPPEK